MTAVLEMPRTGLEARAGRVDSLDLLRGVAILGIFLMNTQLMGLPESAYTNPASWKFFAGANWATWVVVHILADMKFITIFSMMFGAGILLQGERMAARGLSGTGVHYRRMAVLLAIGIVHAYVLWFGDILTTYALCGMLLYPLRRLPAWALVACGMAMIFVAPAVTFCVHAGIFDSLQRLNDWGVGLYGNLDEIAAYRHGGWAELRYRAVASLDLQTRVFVEWTFWRCGGAILVGMGLQRWRFFQATWPAGVYGFLALVLIPVGWAISGLGVWFNEGTQWDQWSLIFPGMEFNYFGSLLAALGYMAVGVLVAIWVGGRRRDGKRMAGSDVAGAAVSPVRSVGQMALTNYLFQSVVGTTIFYGHGLGYFGRMGMTRLMAIAAATWVVQLAGSWWWRRTFRQGPVEWAWRKLAYLGHTEVRTGA